MVANTHLVKEKCSKIVPTCQNSGCSKPVGIKLYLKFSSQNFNK